MFNYANAAIASLKQFEIFYEYLYLATSMSVIYVTLSQTAYPVNKINRICLHVILAYTHENKNRNIHNNLYYSKWNNVVRFLGNP